MRTDDGSIIHRCLNGEPEAFGILVDKYKEGIYAFVYAKLRDFRDAQDVTQEVFVKAYSGLHSLRRWESFSFWLYRIASTRCKLWIRTQSRRIDRDFIEDQDPGILQHSYMEPYRANRMVESVREVLDSLPDAYREVIVLHYFAGMNSKEIARATGASPGAIRVRLSRARTQMKEEMVAMMDTAFEGQRLPTGFTFHIVEAVKHIKIHPMPRMAGLPWGLSAAAGIIITVLSLNPHMSMTSNMLIPKGLPLPVESEVLKTGEIPVDILKASEISAISSKQGDGDRGKPQRDPQNAFMLTPHAEGGEWAEKTDMPTARYCLDTCVVDGKIYAIGGSDPQQFGLSTVEEYDPTTDTWIKKANMPTAREGLGTSVVNEKIYAIGGLNEGGSLSTVEEYNPATDMWTRKADMPTARSSLSTCTVNGKIYAIGGVIRQNSPGISTVEEYDPVTDTWVQKADMPTPRTALDTALVNGKIYAIGGTAHSGKGPDLSTVEEYDPVTDIWTRRTDMLAKRWHLSTAAVNGKIYAIGGSEVKEGDIVVYRPPEVYYPVTDTWTELPDMQIPRMWLSSSAVNGKIYAIGGASALMLNEHIVYSTIEEYTPEDWHAVSLRGKLPTKWGEVKSD